jgi:hypothetical protein
MVAARSRPATRVAARRLTQIAQARTFASKDRHGSTFSACSPAAAIRWSMSSASRSNIAKKSSFLQV